MGKRGNLDEYLLDQDRFAENMLRRIKQKLLTPSEYSQEAKRYFEEDGTSPSSDQEELIINPSYEIYIARFRAKLREQSQNRKE